MSSKLPPKKQIIDKRSKKILDDIYFAQHNPNHQNIDCEHIQSRDFWDDVTTFLMKIIDNQNVPMPINTRNQFNEVEVWWGWPSQEIEIQIKFMPMTTYTEIVVILFSKSGLSPLLMKYFPEDELYYSRYWGGCSIKDIPKIQNLLIEVQASAI